jgi:predicted RNase H-like nuclease
MKFIGIDLGWSSGASGLCCLKWENNRLQILDLTCLLETEKIFAWIDHWVAPQEPALIAVDAPTIIPNQTGTRLPDKLTHKYFGRYHAGCYPANLNRPFAQRTVGFGISLEQKGFLHAATITPQQLGRYQIEVFPHPATINLFGLTKILKYKKGKLAERQAELIKLHRYITTVLPTLIPKLNLTLNESHSSLLALAVFYPKGLEESEPLPTAQTTGNQLKAIEDRLDSLLCAYIAAHWWYWGEERNLVLGNLDTGYIVVPTTHQRRC